MIAHAIIAVADDGTAKLLRWTEHSEEWMVRALSDFDDLAEGGFELPAGVYKARLRSTTCGKDGGHSYYCEGDCFDGEWDIGDCLYLVSPRLILGGDADTVRKSE